MNRNNPTTRWMLLAALAVAAAAFVLGPQRGLADSDVTRALSDAVGAMRFVRGLDRIPPFPRDLDRAVARVAQCRSSLSKARRAGISDNSEIDVRDNRDFPGARSVRQGRGFSLVGQVGKVAAYCEGIARRIEVARSASFVSYAHGRTNRLRSRSAKSPELILEVRRAGEQCMRMVAAGIAAGVPRDTELDLGSSKVRVADANASVCNAAITASVHTGKAMVAERSDDLAPYRQALAGDRWLAFSDNLLFGAQVFAVVDGERQRLESPADFAGNDVWFEIYTNDVLWSEWVVRRYEFKNSKLAATRVTRGRGISPPPSIIK